MAVIRPTAPRRFRHYGSPEQGRKKAVRLLPGNMNVMLKRWVYLTLLGWFVTLVTALVASPFVWRGWNLGVVPAMGTHEISYSQAYFFTLFVAAFGSLFKSMLVVNITEEQSDSLLKVSKK